MLASTGRGPLPRLLLVDDDTRLLAVLSRALGLKGFAVETATGAGEALAALDLSMPDLIVLDIMMPGFDGLRLCRLIRQQIQAPILMLTARDGVPDRVAGLEAGADDYLVKPFAVDELVARLNALLRRSGSFGGDSNQLQYRDLVLDRNLWEVRRAGLPLSLTAMEFKILEALMRAPERVVTREEILAAAWGGEDAAESNVVDVHIASLRQKLEAGRGSRLIQTVRGVGYILRTM